MNLYPTTGIPAINTLYVVEGCEHPAAAKLLIRFMMGGIDGDTSGYEPSTPWAAGLSGTTLNPLRALSPMRR